MTASRALLIFLEGLIWVLMILTPAIGVWVASSLAAYLNGPIWLALACGLLLFPVLPLLWDHRAGRRFARRMERREAAGKTTRGPVLKFSERMIARTFLVNLAFLAALLATFPQSGFAALAARGDWFTAYLNDNHAAAIRPTIFGAAEGLAWLYELTFDNPYAEYKSDDPLPKPKSSEIGEVTRVEVTTETPDDGTEAAEKPAEVAEQPRLPGEPPAWPMPATLHPLVENFPAEHETDYETVARYIRDNEPDPFLRIKALNDYVTQRVAYDYPALRSKNFPSQEAADVFAARKGVCAGYSKLFAAMGQAIGEEVVYIVGVSRDMAGEVSGGGHAWNAAKIEGKWYLIDVTWNDGDYEFAETKYNTDYLFAPPAVFGQDHLPDDEAWQLRADPITRGEFIRQPMMGSNFFASGFRLVSPQRSQIDAQGGVVEVQLENPQGLKVSALTLDAAEAQTRCKVEGTAAVTIRCEVEPGKHRLNMFAGPSGVGSLPYIGSFEVTAR